jgi:hypothetical protein
MSSASKISAFKNDKNNNLTEKQCEAFIKDYKQYKNGKITKINNPKTNKSINDADRIKYIYEKCKKNYEFEGLLSSPKSKSKSSSPESGDNEVILDSYAKVQDIIYMPINTLAQNRKFIESLFAKPIILDNGLHKLKEYLEINRNATVEQNKYVNSYYRILEEINRIMTDIYASNTFAADILTRQYDWEYGYNYDPFRIDKVSSKMRPNIINSIKNTGKKIKGMWKNTKYKSPTDPRKIPLEYKPYTLFRNIIMYSEHNRNREDIIRKLDNNIEKYLALQFIHVLIRDNYENNYTPQSNDVNKNIFLLDTLITKNIQFDYSDDSISVSKSLDWSGTPRSSSSNHSHFQSKANIERYKKTKEEMIADILQNNMNDSDLSGDEWKDMSVAKLKKVISIPSVINGKTYRHAFYVRTLYQYWRNSVKSDPNQRKPFVNPYNRTPFTEEDKETIMNAMLSMYPRLQRPTYGQGRRDISYHAEQEYNGISMIFQYILKIPNQENILVPLIHIITPLSFPNQDIDSAYIPQILFDNINYLVRNKKLFGKSVPIKPLNVLIEYNNTTLDTMEKYMDFFDKIKNAL